MRIAVPDFVSSTFFPLIAAKALGIFEEEGEDVEIVLANGLGAVKSSATEPLIFPPARHTPR